MRKLTDRDIATLLAALRQWQDNLDEEQVECFKEHFTECTPLDEEEIDELCKVINCGEGIIWMEE